MHDPELAERIRAYIEQNRATYTIQALRSRLIADGVPAEAVDAVIAEMSGSAPYGPPLQTPRTAPRGSTWRLGHFLLIVPLGVVANILVLTGAIAIYAYTYSNALFLLVGVGALVGEVLLAVKYAKSNSSVTAGLLVAICMTPVVVGVLLLGACIVLIATLK